jgi:tRNA-2-methylthio-N6-dimethylallyladenosine synthase
VVEKSRFATAFTFQYSNRPGTPAADLPDQLPKAVVQERFERLTALQDRIAAEENAKQLGRRVEVMVTAQSGRKAEETHRLSGRSRDQRLVHFSVPEGAEPPRPGDLVTVTITEAAAFHLVADPALEDYSLRRSRAGDAWDRSQADTCGAPVPTAAGGGAAGGSRTGVSLGMPTLPARSR